MKCENCGHEHDGSYGSGRFCSSKCARGFSTKKKRKEINQKVSQKLKIIREPKICPTCNEIFIPKRKGKFCSRLCARKHNNQLRIQKAIKVIRENVKNGTHKGWQSRNILSYPEKFFIEVLKNNNLFDKCKTNYPFKRYFLDFYFEDKKLDLEIDGKQHEYDDRKKSDLIRDAILNRDGVIVYRIKWKSINSDAGKIYIADEISKFLNFYNSI